MRCAVVLIISLALNLVSGFRPSMRGLSARVRRDCQRQIPISNEDLEKLRKAILNEDNEIQKCYIKCVLKSLNFMDTSGKITSEKGLSTIPPEMAALLKRPMDVCSSIVSDGEDSCEKAMELYRCIHAEFPKITKFL